MTEEETIKEVMMVINDALIEYFRNSEDLDPNLIMNVLLNLISHYCAIMEVDASTVLQRGADAYGGGSKNVTSIGGVPLEFE